MTSLPPPNPERPLTIAEIKAEAARIGAELEQTRARLELLQDGLPPRRRSLGIRIRDRLGL